MKNIIIKRLNIGRTTHQKARAKEMKNSLIEFKLYDSVDEIGDDILTDAVKETYQNAKIAFLSYGNFRMYFPLEAEYARKHTPDEIKKHLIAPFKDNYTNTKQLHDVSKKKD